ncbi:GntR family transcriptional regulator (plasmid) [Burkholderia sp. SFA1]|nr:GntR family transcriptional regulator [Burkholderia sp. SFA1]
MPVSAARVTVQEKIYADLRMSLMRGRFDPGQPMVIQALASAYGTSPMPVREAVRQLVAENGLKSLPNGTVQVPQVSEDKLHDLCEARLALEGLATSLACEHMTTATLRKLKGLIAEHEHAMEDDGIYTSLDKNQEFHFLIYATSRSTVLPPLIESLWLQYGPYMRFISRHLGSQVIESLRSNGTDFHHLLLEAFEKRNPAAARAAMESDIRRTTNMLSDLLKSGAHTTDPQT